MKKQSNSQSENLENWRKKVADRDWVNRVGAHLGMFDNFTPTTLWQTAFDLTDRMRRCSKVPVLMQNFVTGEQFIGPWWCKLVFSAGCSH